MYKGGFLVNVLRLLKIVNPPQKVKS
jgi:hypothetical protein